MNEATAESAAGIASWRYRIDDPVLLTFDNQRAAQKLKCFGDIFPAELPEGLSGKTFLDFFQTDKVTGNRKGIVGIRLRRKRQ